MPALVFVLAGCTSPTGSEMSPDPGDGTPTGKADTFTKGPFVFADACMYDNTLYFYGDGFSDTEQCNSCHCSEDGIGCTEIGCLGPDGGPYEPPNKNYSLFASATDILCEKWSDRAGVKWEVRLRDGDGDGEFVVTATRAGEALYHPDYDDLYLTLRKSVGGDKIAFESDRGTVFLDITRAYGDTATGFFASQRYERQVSNLACRVLERGGDLGGDSCLYENTVYFYGDGFDAADGCNHCSCSEDGVACTELGCSDDPPVLDFDSFATTREILCRKDSESAGVRWEINLRDADGDGEFLLWATRAGVALYDPDAANGRVVLKRSAQENKISFVSPEGTLFLDVTRAYGSTATGYFSTARYDKRVSNMRCQVW